MTVTDPMIDTLFDGRYRIVRKLGSGGMANVYLAEDQELGRRVAIKILNERHAGDEQFVERFRREAKHAASLSHPNVVSIYDRGEAEGTYYIAMEYIEGRTLKELILARGPAPVGTAIDYTRQILAALKFSHRNGVIHRDIKPHNVIVDGDGRVKVMDFGIARAGASQMTEAGSIVGTAQYLSPEQARGAPVDQTSDLYSVGIVLYELLTGTVPFTGDTPVEIAMKHLQATPEAPSARRSEIPDDLDMVVLRALAKDPKDRYASAEEMDAELLRVARGHGVAQETADTATMVLSGASTAPTTISSAPTAIRRAEQPSRYYEYETVTPRRRSAWPWLLALGLVVALAAGGWFAYDRIQEQLAEARPVVVPMVEGILEENAVEQIRDAGLVENVVREPHSEVEEGRVFEQEPSAGDRLDRGSFVTIHVSTGKPEVKVPDVVGQSVADAVAELNDAGLEANPVEINSEREAGTVTAQAPKAGETVVEGTRIRINVSKGPKPIAVPGVVGQLYESAASILQAAGFAVAKEDVEADDPAGVVVGQDPAAGATAAKGAVIRLQVSEGPATSTVPDVSSYEEPAARDTLQQSGFRVRVQRQDVEDESLDGVVLSQDPPGGTEAEPNTQVTIVVGRWVGPPPEDGGAPPSP